LEARKRALLGIEYEIATLEGYSGICHL
jgi:hypothetical protein